MIARRALQTALGEMQLEPDAPRPDGDDWRCEFRLRGALTDRSAFAMGVDAFQALRLALGMIATDLRFSAEFEAGPLRWLDLDEPGFALSKALADLGWGRPDSAMAAEETP